MIPLSDMRTMFAEVILKGQLPSIFLLLVVPLVVIELGLVIFALVDLAKPDRQVVGGSKMVWALVIVLVGTIGPIAYLLAGRRQD